MDDAAQGAAKLGHGQGGGGRFISQVIDGSFLVGAHPALSFVGQIQDHPVESALVGDGCYGADLTVQFGPCSYLLSQVGPGN